MNDAEAKQTMQQGFEILCLWSRSIAMLPLEDWWNALERAESVGPILDPTLYREYLYSEKAKIIKKLIEAAIPLKSVVLQAQPECLKEFGETSVSEAR